MVEILSPIFSYSLSVEDIWLLEMLNTFSLFPLLLLCFLGLTSSFSHANQESFDTINLFDKTFQPGPGSGLRPLAVPVKDGDLHAVSTSVLMAESWLRIYVLAHYPATKITTIVLGDTVFSNKDQVHKLGLVLSSMKNLFHSLTRWGLQKDIKVSASFSFDCLDPFSVLFKDDLAEKMVRALLEFMQSKNSSISLPQNAYPISDESQILVTSFMESVKKLGFSEFSKAKVNVIVPNQREYTNRKLSSIDSKFLQPFPKKPTPSPETADSPSTSSHGYTIPSNIAKHPKSLPPLSHISSPSPLPLPFAPASPPSGFELPPCKPGKAGAPDTVVVQRRWCVAKPNVPEETLQEAIDYACGAGGGDCDEIMPNGSCFFPDTVVAHASYAFNSYWQKNKRRGGTCSFGGTAMIINSDPSLCSAEHTGQSCGYFADSFPILCK